jgi:hypothetical protein
MALSRRAFLAGLASAVLVGPARAEESRPARLRGWRWQGGVAGGRGALGASTVVRAPYEFNAVGVAWLAAAGPPRLRTSPDGSAWSEWTTVTTHELHGAIPPPGQRYFGDLVTTEPSRYVEVAAAGAVEGLQLDLIDTIEGPTSEQLAARAALANVTVIPRAGWGCDERLGLDNRGAEIWPVRHFPPEKVVVHHTVTANREANPAATVRSVYYYHAVTQGWGDVGYNYLVDWRGNVYEGREGGPGVEAGHAFGHNSASIGIACLGTHTSEGITFATRQSLARLIADRARYLDPHGSSWFVDGEMPNLMGHRDAMQFRPGQGTSCPGDALHALLPGLRGDVLFNLGDRPVQRAELIDVKYEGNPALPGGTIKVHATIRNSGTATLTSQYQDSGFLYDEGESHVSRGQSGRAGAWRLGLELNGGGYPFRWALPEALEPGRTMTVVGAVRLGGLGQREAGTSLIQEGRGVEVAGPARELVRVFDPSTLTWRTIVPLSARAAKP